MSRQQLVLLDKEGEFICESDITPTSLRQWNKMNISDAASVVFFNDEYGLGYRGTRVAERYMELINEVYNSGNPMVSNRRSRKGCASEILALNIFYRQLRVGVTEDGARYVSIGGKKVIDERCRVWNNDMMPVSIFAGGYDGVRLCISLPMQRKFVLNLCVFKLAYLLFADDNSDWYLQDKTIGITARGSHLLKQCSIQYEKNKTHTTEGIPYTELAVASEGASKVKSARILLPLMNENLLLPSKVTYDKLAMAQQMGQL